MDLKTLFGLPMRPLLPGEQRNNPDGTYSTELLATTQAPDGAWVNVPTLWRRQGQYVELPEDQAAQTALGLARLFGAPVQEYPDMQSAARAAEQTSAAGGRSWGRLLSQRSFGGL